MKISKLKFVFAFVLLSALLVVGTNVQAARPVNGQIQVSTILTSLQSIVSGDEGNTKPAVVNVLDVSNTHADGITYGGVTMNPVQSYNLLNKLYNNTTKAYSMTPGNVVGDENEFTWGGVASDDLGIALIYGNTIPNGDEAATLATQAYIWLYQNGFAGENDLVSALEAKVPGVQYAYTYIKNSANQSKLAPSFAKSNEAEARAIPFEMRWNEANQRYEYTVEDVNALNTMAYVNLTVDAGNISYSKNGNSITFFTTEQVGSASNPATVTIRKSINGGRYGAATASAAGKEFVYYTGAQRDSQVYYVSFYTNALRVKVHKTLQAGTNPKTGDATVAGARYGIYSDEACTKLVQEVVTDAQGYATSDPVEFADYWVKELAVSEGCKIDSAVKKAAKNAATDVNGQKVVTVESEEPVIYGGFRMVVSNSDLSGNTTKFPSVGSEITVTLDSNSNENYVGVVNDIGVVEFTNLPYGHYTVTETKRVNDKLNFMDPLSIFIDREETYIYSKIINTDIAERYIKLIKLDAESKDKVTMSKTLYSVRDDKGNIISQKVMYPNEMVLNQYSTENLGYLVMPAKLPAGTYKVYEDVAPEGYYNATKDPSSSQYNQPVSTFTVEHVEGEPKDKIIEVPNENIPQKGIVTVTTRGNVLTGTNSVNKYGETVNQPAYTSQALSGAKFQIIAKEDIVTGDGFVHYRAGQVVDEFTSDATGEHKTKLYIGSYTLKMVEAPAGYAIDATERILEVTAQAQSVKEYNLPKQAYTLERQTYELDVTKVLEGLKYYRSTEGGIRDPHEPMTNAEAVEPINVAAFGDVLVGIYAAEDIADVNGVKRINANTLVDVVTFDDNGKGTFLSEYPMGKFYAKEIRTNINYELSDTKYNFETKPANNTDKVFNISVGTIVNEAIKSTKFTLQKIEELYPAEVNNEQSLFDKVASVIDKILSAFAGADDDANTDVILLPDAEVQLYFLAEDGKYYPLLEKVGEDYVEVVCTTNEKGEFTIEGLPYGTYAVKETKAPRYYELNEALVSFTLSPENKTEKRVLMDERILVAFDIAVEDETETPLEEVKVQLVDPETKKVAYEVVTDENGVAHFEDVRAGRYIRQVAGLEKWYVTPATKEYYLEKDTELLETVKVNYVRGNILINKTDDETGEPVPGCKFQIVDEDDVVVVEETTDDNGQLYVTGLLYGKYTVKEVEAPEGYEKSDLEMEVKVTENDFTYVVDFTNVPTGDIAVALYAIVALVSVSAIVVATKKLRRN